jgi:hypothetical protein
VKELEDNDVECSKMGGEQMFTMKSEVVGRSSVVSDDLVQNVDQKLVKDGSPQFQNIRVNFHKFQALFSARLS